jgi:glutamyl-tRNA synthetase
VLVGWVAGRTLPHFVHAGCQNLVGTLRRLMADGRYAPSPTGALHVGNLRTALLAWCFARSTGSRFRLRVDDLDPADARPDLEAAQLRDLAAIGLDWDQPVVHQSERRHAHDTAIASLAAMGRTYECWCTRREIREAPRAPHGPPGAYPGTCRRLGEAERAANRASGRPAALRLDALGEEVVVHDRLRGEVRGVVDDLVLRRNDGIPSYNLATVVDDAAAGVEEVVRADDLLDTTPRQALLAQLLDLPVPAYAHVPLVVGPDGERLAKRHGAVSLAELSPLGVGPMELRAELAASVGLCEPGEHVALDELLERFDPDQLPTAPWTWEPPA